MINYGWILNLASVIGLSLSSIAFAAPTLAITPDRPGTADVVILSGDGFGCPWVTSVEMVRQTIRVTYDSAVDCFSSHWSDFDIDLGRFPTGTYAVEVFNQRNQSVPEANASFSVAPYGNSVVDASGHWDAIDYGATIGERADREAVTVGQAGGVVFISWLTYDEGEPTWYVVPRAVPSLIYAGETWFSGAIYTVHRDRLSVFRDIVQEVGWALCVFQALRGRCEFDFRLPQVRSYFRRLSRLPARSR